MGSTLVERQGRPESRFFSLLRDQNAPQHSDHDEEEQGAESASLPRHGRYTPRHHQGKWGSRHDRVPLTSKTARNCGLSEPVEQQGRTLTRDGRGNFESKVAAGTIEVIEHDVRPVSNPKPAVNR